jgi:hypothetical protein
MSNFTIRILVHEDNSSSADELNKAMEVYGFKRKISSDSGNVYILPPGEFSYSGDIDRKTLLEKVKASVGQIGKRYSVLITESKGRTWYNLTSE